MPCYRPFKAFRSATKNDAGRYPLTGNPLKALNSTNPLTLPCGQCNGCKADRAEEWALRCYHESQTHQANSFITLTFSDSELPEDYSVHVRTWQLFMKRLRYELNGTKLRFFACGEYGEQTNRPHYHALIFGYDFSNDRKLLSEDGQGNCLYQSELLQKVWPYGHSTIGDVTYASAKYCAQYIMKKVKPSHPSAADHYLRIHPITNKLVTVQPEFACQSRRPGLGTTWFDKFKSDAFPSDFIVVEGKMHAVPRFYDRKLQEEELATIKCVRKRKSIPHKGNNTKERLAVRELVAEARSKLYGNKRKI